MNDGAPVPSRRQTFSPIAAFVVALVAVAGYLAWRGMYRPPYLLRIKSTPGGAVVQFEQPGSGADPTLISPRFDVPVQVDRALQLKLASPEVKIPGGEIEFADITTTPGRFTLRFGDKTIDVMEARIIVDGVSHEWAVQE